MLDQVGIDGRVGAACIQQTADSRTRPPQDTGDALPLDDIDWRAGEITVTGKGRRSERLPLSADADEAVAAWRSAARSATGWPGRRNCSRSLPPTCSRQAPPQ